MLALGVVHVSMCMCVYVCVCVWSKDGISYGNQLDVYIIIRGVWGAGNVICTCI